ncbi:MAG: thiosulfate/3-mercaptopyruvate sulfurtransferase [Chloroflexota bacterium]|jgi:thiosulfate/3-mercaptopyruvate sulfurtransferase|nr:thiosulfate/3-mercaptopyruvate sulfurtransferase [Chloroflexota bacterium]
MQPFAVGPDLLATPQWLQAHRGESDLVVADCRYDDDAAAAAAAYRAGHIPGAVHVFWPRDLAAGGAPVPNLLPAPEQAADRLGGLGIGDDTLVVAYDADGGHHASRLWLVLAYFGHDRFKLLDGGIQAWEAAGGALEQGDVQPVRRHFSPQAPRESLRIRADELANRLGEPGMQLVDVRRATEFDGSEARAARGGRIPGARHLPWQDNVNADHTLHTPEEIRARHAAAGLDPEREIVTYCQAGVRAAHAALALLLAGYPRVRVYDGSWAEWGNRPDLPIETGPTS